MTVSIILAIAFIILGIVMSYGYIRLSIAKEKENELLKEQIKQYSNEKEYSFKVQGKDLISVINKNIAEQDRAQV